MGLDMQLVLLEIFNGLVLLGGIFLSFMFFSAGIWVLRNPHEMRANKEALKMYHSGCPLHMLPFDYRSRIEPGIAINKKTNSWILVANLTSYAFKSK